MTTIKHDDAKCAPIDRGVMPKQTIYEHGGSRIWIEEGNSRRLLADTYGIDGDTGLAEAVMKCITEYLTYNAQFSRADEC